MADPDPDDIQRFIADGLACEHVEVEGDGRHFFATIVSAEFEGTSRIARHQRVYQAPSATACASRSTRCR